MSQDFQAGDYLVFQIEAGFGLLRLLAVDETGDERVWHVAAYEDLFLDVDSADNAISSQKVLRVNKPHIALTTRAFEATQTARIGNKPLTEEELGPLAEWHTEGEGGVSDLSVRLLLGLR